MAQERIVYYPVPFIVLHPLVPVTIGAVLPVSISRVLGIKALHSTGIEKMTTAKYLPVIGHLSLEFNSRQYHFGHLDIAFDHQPQASDAYLDADITLQPGTLFTGNYENKVFTGTEYTGADGSLTNKWHHYIVTIYLKTLSHD
jgi:hypothetical protein